MIEIRKHWFRKGLQFECRRCGYCCCGFPGGYVWLGEGESEKIAGHLGISVEEFAVKHLKNVDGRYSLVVYPSGRCVFYDDGCRIYPARPFQCNSFPFWPQILKSRRSWDKYSEDCPGMNSGKLHSYPETMRLLLKFRKIYR